MNRKCPPCDGECRQGRDCPCNDYGPVEKTARRMCRPCQIVRLAIVFALTFIAYYIVK